MYKTTRKPDFNNLLSVLKKEKPSRPTLFEFFLNGTLYGMLSEGEFTPKGDGLDYNRTLMHAFKNAGYDYFTSGGSSFGFHSNPRAHERTASINDGFIITDRKSFEEYKWNEVENCDYSHLSKIAPELPDGMKIICSGPGGVLENAISLVGYDNLCFMLYDDPELAEEIFKNIGERELKHYKACLEHDSVGAVIGNDDWGFKTQTMLSVEQMRKYVFPWHKKIVALAHEKGRPAILHSCGYAGEIMDDIIDDMKYDGKHSYEDIIQPVEDAYDQYHKRIAIMGGIDVGFLCSKTPEEVAARAKSMLERSAQDGAFGLGSGNSIPEYIPHDAYFAMIGAVR